MLSVASLQQQICLLLPSLQSFIFAVALVFIATHAAGCGGPGHLFRSSEEIPCFKAPRPNSARLCDGVWSRTTSTLPTNAPGLASDAVTKPPIVWPTLRTSSSTTAAFVPPTPPPINEGTVACPAGAVRKGMHCHCDFGYSGTLAWSQQDGRYLGECTRTPCPPSASPGRYPGTCTFDPPFQGKLVWQSLETETDSGLSHWLGNSRQFPCPPNSAQADSSEPRCQCDAQFAGGYVWNPSLQKFEGQCDAGEDGVGNVDSDSAGAYWITKDAMLETRSACENSVCDDCARLPVGQRVAVVEIIVCEYQCKVRARLQEPAGWITLLDTETSQRWAERACPSGSTRQVGDMQSDCACLSGTQCLTGNIGSCVESAGAISPTVFNPACTACRCAVVEYDANDCCIACGYLWCDILHKCVQPWVEPCPTTLQYELVEDGVCSRPITTWGNCAAAAYSLGVISTTPRSMSDASMPLGCVLYHTSSLVINSVGGVACSFADKCLCEKTRCFDNFAQYKMCDGQGMKHELPLTTYGRSACISACQEAAAPGSCCGMNLPLTSTEGIAAEPWCAWFPNSGFSHSHGAHWATLNTCLPTSAGICWPGYSCSNDYGEVFSGREDDVLEACEKDDGCAATWYSSDMGRKCSDSEIVAMDGYVTCEKACSSFASEGLCPSGCTWSGGSCEVGYVDLGVGKCKSEDGSQTKGRYHGGKGTHCQRLCDQSSTCYGYSVNGKDCVHYETHELWSGGPEWGNAHCIVRKSVLAVALRRRSIGGAAMPCSDSCWDTYKCSVHSGYTEEQLSIIQRHCPLHCGLCSEEKWLHVGEVFPEGPTRWRLVPWNPLALSILGISAACLLRNHHQSKQHGNYLLQSSEPCDIDLIPLE